MQLNLPVWVGCGSLFSVESDSGVTWKKNFAQLKELHKRTLWDVMAL
jgi:hypothetical protein